MAQLKDLLVEGKSRFIDKIYASDQFISKVVQGTSPFLIDSSTLVSNLNVDLLDGFHAFGTDNISNNRYLLKQAKIDIGATTEEAYYRIATLSNGVSSNNRDALFYTIDIIFNRYWLYRVRHRGVSATDREYTIAVVATNASASDLRIYYGAYNESTEIFVKQVASSTTLKTILTKVFVEGQRGSTLINYIQLDTTPVTTSSYTNYYSGAMSISIPWDNITGKPSAATSFGYIGTTAVQASSTANQDLTGIGTIYIKGNGNSWTEGIRIKPNNSWATILLGGNDLTADSGTSANSWSIHNYNGSFYIAKNGSGASGTNTAVFQNVSNNWNFAKGNVGIGVASPSAPLDVSGGYIKVTWNGNTLSIGSGNTSWTHFSNSAARPFYFSNSASFNGNVLPYVTNSYSLGDSDHRWVNTYTAKVLTANYEISESTNSRLSVGNAGQSAAKGLNVGDLLVSSAWADYTKVPTNGIYSKGQIKSGVAQGTAPLVVDSSTLVSNLNVDLLDGKHADDFLFKLRRLNETFGHTSFASGMFPPTIFELKNAGYPVYTDPEFASGQNSVSVYNNSGGGTVTITREQAGDHANSSGYQLKIVTNGTASPGAGGFVQTITSRANAIFVQVFRAKVPVGYNVTYASNSMGTSYQDKFITNRAGTGKWEWYARVVYCGASGTFSSGGHVYLSPDSGYSATSVTWYLSYCNLIDITKLNYDGLRTRYADSATDATYMPLITSSTANYVDSAMGKKMAFNVYALTGSAPTPVSGTGPSTGDGFFMVFNYNDAYVTQIAVDLDPTYKLSVRHWKNDASTWRPWRDILTTANYTSYLGYIGTTAVQASSAAQAVTGITALTFNGATSAGTNYITGTAGRIYFGGNFHLDSLGSNATYINYYTGNNVYLVSGSTQGKVGIGTSSPSEKLHIIGSIYADSTPTSNASKTQYISAGPGYSTAAGKYGVKVVSCDQSDTQTGLGQDLGMVSGWSGWENNYNLSIAGGNNSSDVGKISFVSHKVNSTTYRYLGGFLDTAGTIKFNVQGTGLFTGSVGIGTNAPENKLDVNGVASIYPRGADNTAFKGNLIIKQQNSAEDTGQGYTGSKPSFGIQFNRFWTNSSGAYGETPGAGIFATVSSSWRGGLVFRTKDNQTQGGTHDTNALRLRPDGNAVFAGGVGSPGTNGNATGSYIAYPKGGCYATNTSSVTGYLKITLPQKGKNTMMSFDVTIYTYDGANQSYTTYHISGYEYSTNGWYNPVTKVYSEGIGPYTNLTVRLGNDGTYACVTIGEANTVWTYPQVTVHNIMTGYSGCDVDTWIGGWAVGFTTTALTTVVSEKTAVNTQNINVSGSAGSVAWGNITGKPSSFSPSDHNHDGRYLQYNGWWTSGNGNNADNANGMVFAYSNHNVPTGWGILTTFDYQYNSSYKMQLFSYGYTNGYTYYRNRSADRNGWNAWVRFLDSTNYTEYLTDTKVTQTVTGSSNTSWRPLIIGASYSDATTFAPSTITDITYATHLAKFKPSTGQLALSGLYKMNTNGTVATGANDEVWNTNGTTVKISTLFTTEPEYLTLEVKNATSPSTPITEYVGVTITNKFTNETIYDGIVYQNTHLVPGTATYTTDPISIPPGIEYVVSCSYITGYASPDPGIFLSIPGYSRILTLNFIPVRVDILSIDFTKGDAPSAFLTYTPASGTSVVQWIRNNSHRYAAYFAKLTSNVTDGNNAILSPRGAQMYICQLKDSDSTRFANDNSYLYPTDASVENGDIYMRLPKFYYRVTGNSTTFTVEFADVNPNQPGFQEWDSNNMIAVYPSSYRTGILMNNSSSTKIDAYISSPYFENSTISSNDICLNVSSCKLSSATISSSGTTVDKFAGGLDKASIKNMYPNVDVKFLRYKWVQILRLLFMAYYQTTDCVSVCGTGRRSGIYTPSAQGTQGRGMTDTTSSTGNDKPVNFWGVESLWGISSIYSDVAWQYYHLNSNASNVNKLGLLADNVPVPDLLSSGDVVYKFGSVPSSSDLYYGRTVSILPGTPTTTEQKLTYSPVGFSYGTGGSATSRWFSSYNLNTAMSTGYTYNGFVLYGANSLFQEGAYRTAASGFARICYYGPIQEVYSPTVFYNSIKPNSAIYRRLRGNTAIPAG